MVYITQAYPGLKPYLKGFHLSLETWRGGRNQDGWRIKDRDRLSDNYEPWEWAPDIDSGVLLHGKDWDNGQNGTVELGTGAVPT